MPKTVGGASCNCVRLSARVYRCLFAPKEFYNGAFRLAIETQTPVKPLLFLDTYDRMSYKQLLSLKPGINRAVYLEEVSVEGLTVKDTEALKQKVYELMEAALIRYKASWIKQ
jgi:1-acyl-sn-glycerol-3-phosphate acyltransferase